MAHVINVGRAYPDRVLIGLVHYGRIIQLTYKSVNEVKWRMFQTSLS
jgi:hypothetical protein